MIILFLILGMTRGAAEVIKPVRIAISSSPSNLSPFFSTDGNSQNILRLIHTSLIDFNKKMQVTCRLCISFKEWKSDGKHHIRFLLKKNTKFYDGSLLTSKDVKKSWQYYTDNKKIKSIFRFAFGNIEKILIHSDYDVELIYKNFDMSNLTNLTLFKIIKIYNYNKKEKIEVKDIISAGLYKVGVSEEMKIDLLSLNQKSPNLNFIVVKDETTLALKLMGGEVDLSLANISPRKLQWLKSEENIKLNFSEELGSNYKYLGINHNQKYLKNKNIRKALYSLIPREKIIKYKLKSTAVLSTGLFSKAFADYYRVPKIDTKVSAHKILKSEGYTLNSDNFYSKNNEVIKLSIRTSSNKSAVEVATVISHYFNHSGIKTDIITSEWGSFMKALKSGRFDLVLGQWIGFAGPEMLKSTFHSESMPPKGLNRGRFSNKEFDNYINLSVNSLNKEKRLKNYHLAMDIVDEELPYMNLWHPNIIWISRKCIKFNGVYPNGSFLALLPIENNCGQKKDL